MDDTDFSTNDFFVNPYGTPPTLHPKGIAATALISIRASNLKPQKILSLALPGCYCVKAEFGTDMRPHLKKMNLNIVYMDREGDTMSIASRVIVKAKGGEAGKCEKFARYYRALCPDLELERMSITREDTEDVPNFNREYPRNPAKRGDLIRIHFQADLRDPDLEELTVAPEDMDAPDFSREHPRNAAKCRKFE
nr:cytochrome C oxidase subunit 6B-2 [Ipomoea batatas]